MTTQITTDSIRATLKQDEERNRILDHTLHALIAPLTGADPAVAPLYSDAVAGQPYLYKALYSLFPNVEINMRRHSNDQFLLLASLGNEEIYFTNRFTNPSAALIDLLMHMVDQVSRDQEEELVTGLYDAPQSAEGELQAV